MISLILLFSQTSPGLSFLNMKIDGKVIALGGAYTGIISPEGAYFNPAIAGEFKGLNFSSAYSYYFLGSHLISISSIIPLNGEKGVGFGLRGFYTGGIENRPEDDPWNLSYYSSYFLIGHIDYGMRLKNLLFGAGLNIGNFRIEHSGGTGVFLNAGLKYTDEMFNAGLSITNLGTRILRTSLPITFQAGGGLNLFDKKLHPVVDIRYTLKAGLSANAGIEFSPVEIFSLRAGYNPDITSSGLFKGITMGFGLNLKTLSINYAAIPGSNLGVSHFFTISYSPGREEKPKKIVVQETFSKERMMSDKLVEQGISYFKEKKYKEAMNYFDLSLIWNPNNRNAKQWLDKVTNILNTQEVEKYISLGKNKMASGDYLNAVYYFGKALSIDSTNQMAIKLKRNAEEKIRRGVKSTSTREMELALKYYRMGDYSRAISIWEKLLKKDPTNKKVKKYISSAKNKMLEEVSSGIKKIDLYIKQEKLKSAIYLVDKLLKKYKGNKSLQKRKSKINELISQKVKFYLSKGKKAYANGDISSAERYFEKVLEYQPGNKTALGYLEKIGKTMVKNRKDEADRYYILGIEAYTKNNYELAIKYWEKALKLYPNYPNAKENIQRAKLKLKELKKSD